MTRHICILLCAAMIAGSLSAAAAPNIVLILADDMGYGDPGSFNHDSKIATPHIDRLAAEGMRFLDAHAPGTTCVPSRYGLLTGRYPLRANLAWKEGAIIDERQPTLASLLRRAGYETAMIGKWHQGFDGDPGGVLRGGPIDRGFNSFFGIHASTDIPPYYYIAGDRAVHPPTERIAARNSEGWSPIQGAFWREGLIAPGMKLIEVTPEFARRSVQYVRDQAGKRTPYFLYLALPSPHTPWLPMEPWIGRSKAGMYGDFTMMVDDVVGQVLAALDDTGQARNTLVIFTSDNGPVWYPDDVRRFGHASTGMLRGMKGDLWEGGHRMPFVVRWPGMVHPGSTSRQLICFTDLLATFGAIVGTRLAHSPDSVSFLPELTGRDRGAGARQVLITGIGERLSVRKGPWKLIPFLGSGGFSKPATVRPGPGEPPGQLYHLDDDPAETTNLYAQQPQILAELKAILAEYERGATDRPKNAKK